MKQYFFEHSESEITTWRDGTGMGCWTGTLAECLAKAKEMGLTWDEKELPEKDTIAMGEAHVIAAGITGFRLAALQNRLLKAREACESAVPPVDLAVAKPKLVALYTWLMTVEGMAIAGSVQFPAAPHTFEEVVSE